MIDIGNYCFTPRHNIGDGKQNYDIKDYSDYGLGYKGEIPVTPRVMHTYNDIQLGHISYDNIKGAFSTINEPRCKQGGMNHRNRNIYLQ